MKAADRKRLDEIKHRLTWAAYVGTEFDSITWLANQLEAAEAQAQAEQQRREAAEANASRSELYRTWWREEKATRELAEARVRRLEEALLTIAEHERGTWHGQIAERVLSPQEPQEGASRGD